MKKRLNNIGNELARKLKASASEIYENAGSFLMRSVCDTLAALLREAADQIDALDGELSRVKWELVQAEQLINDQSAEITALARRVQEIEPALPLEGFPDSTEGLTGGQGFPKETA